MSYIPRKWKDKMNNLVYRNEEVTISIIIQTNKSIYNKFIEYEGVEPLVRNIWEPKFQSEQTELEDTFSFIFKVLKDNKFKMFKWKLIHNLIPHRKKSKAMAYRGSRYM